MKANENQPGLAPNTCRMAALSDWLVTRDHGHRSVLIIKPMRGNRHERN